MSVLTKLVVDCSTGEQTVVPLTDAEVAEANTRAAAVLASQAKAEQDAREQEDARKSALAKLQALGLSDAEIAALLN